MDIIFRYSKRYFLELNKNKTLKLSWEDVVRLGGMFEEKYSDEIKKIPSIISKILNKEWERDEIDVYIVDKGGPSFAFPLTLKIREDLTLVLVILIHELTHNFINFGEIKTEDEKKINDVVEKVLEELKIDAKDQLEKLRKWSESSD